MEKNMKNKELNLEFYNNAIKKMINKTYKILPMREEGGNYLPIIDGIIKELMGLYDTIYMFKDEKKILDIIWKLNNLKFLCDYDDFKVFRTNVFDIINLLSEMKMGDKKNEMFKKS